MKRLRTFVAAGAVVTAVALTMSSASGAPAANWTQERAGADHRGWNRNETTLTVDNVGNLEPGWGGREIVNSSARFEPIVVGAKVYFVKEDDDFGALIEAKDVSTSDRIWAWSRNGDPQSPPIYANGRIYWLVQGWPDGRPVNDGRQSILYAFNPATGAVVWKVDVTTGHGIGWADSSLVVKGNLAVTTSRLTDGRTVYTFWNAATGQVIKEGAYKGATAVGTTGASISGNRVYLVADRLIALSLTGAVKWTSDQLPVAPLDPVVAGDLVYLPGKSQIRALRTSDGALMFRIFSGGAIAVDGSRLYKVSYEPGSTQSDLEAFDRRTGVRQWATAVPAGSAGQTPTVANGIVFTVVGDGVAAYAALDGSPLWHWTGSATGRMVVANGHVYVGGAAGVRQFHL